MTFSELAAYFLNYKQIPLTTQEYIKHRCINAFKALVDKYDEPFATYLTLWVLSNKSWVNEPELIEYFSDEARVAYLREVFSESVNAAPDLPLINDYRSNETVIPDWLEVDLKEFD